MVALTMVTQQLLRECVRSCDYVWEGGAAKKQYLHRGQTQLCSAVQTFLQTRLPVLIRQSVRRAGGRIQSPLDGARIGASLFPAFVLS